MGYTSPRGKNIPVTQTLYVDNSRTDSYAEEGSEKNPYKTIQEAIDSVIDASNSKKYVVKISSGSYSENLNIKPYVNIKGESKELVKITGTHSCTFNTGGRLEITNLTLKGDLTLDKPAGTIQGISVWLANLWADNIIVNFKGANDYFQLTNDCLINGNIIHHSSHVLLRDSIVYGNIITDDSNLETPDPNYGDSGTRNISNCGCNNVTVRGNSWLELHACHIWGSLTSDGSSAYLNYDSISTPESSSNVVSTNSGNISLMSYASATSYTPSTPSNYSSIPNNIQEALDLLSTDIYNIGSGDVGGIILGTTDAFGRHQIWNKLVSGVLRLGSLSGDGDPTDVSSDGIVSYGTNLSGSPMASNDFSYARIKPYRFGLYDSINGGFVGYIFEFNTHENIWYICDNSGNHLFEFNRTSGSFKCTSLTDGTNSASISDIKSAVDLKHDSSTQLNKNAINGSFTTVDGKTITVVDGQITSIS